jgi:hypothetical protein
MRPETRLAASGSVFIATAVIVAALVLAAAVAFLLRKRGAPPSPASPPISAASAAEATPATATAAPATGAGKQGPRIASVLLGTSGIVALVSTLVTGYFNHLDQVRLREDERSRRELERVDTLYNGAIPKLASGTPALGVVDVYELGGLIQVSDTYDAFAREILGGSVRAIVPSDQFTGPAPGSFPLVRAIVDVLVKQNQDPTLPRTKSCPDGSCAGRMP